MAAHGMDHGLRVFVEALSAGTPTPAGGAAAAAAVATGAGLFLKVGRITHAVHELPAWKEAESRLEALVLRALDAIRTDCDAFESVLAATGRGEEGATAWVRATESPLDVAHTASQALLAFAPFRSRVNAALVADCAAGARLLSAGLSISLENARVNLPSIRSSEDRRRLEQASRERARVALEALAGFELEAR